MLNQTAEYALRAMACMAHEPGRFMSAAELSRATRVPPDYMAKVLQHLAAGDLVIGRRGTNGGYSLGRDRAEITLLEVINAVSPVERITACPVGIRGHAGLLCPLHTCLNQAIEQIQTLLGRDPGRCRRRARGHPLCDSAKRDGRPQDVTLHRA